MLEKCFPALMENAGEANQEGNLSEISLGEQKSTLAEKLGTKVMRQPAGTSIEKTATANVA